MDLNEILKPIREYHVETEFVQPQRHLLFDPANDYRSKVSIYLGKVVLVQRTLHYFASAGD